MKTPNSRNSTALSAAVYENFCPRGPASNTPSPPLVDRHGFFRNPPSPLRCPHGLWMPPTGSTGRKIIIFFMNKMNLHI